MSSKDSVDRLVAAAVERFGKLDVLVNNAGIATMGPFMETTVDDLRSTMATNVDGVFYGCLATVPHLLATRGSILNVSSVSGMGGDWNMSAYTPQRGP